MPDFESGGAWFESCIPNQFSENDMDDFDSGLTWNHNIKSAVNPTDTVEMRGHGRWYFWNEDRTVDFGPYPLPMNALNDAAIYEFLYLDGAETQYFLDLIEQLEMIPVTERPTSYPFGALKRIGTIRLMQLLKFVLETHAVSIREEIFQYVVEKLEVRLDPNVYVGLNNDVRTCKESNI